MKIALIGYGKMGKLIEQIAQERGHSISCRIDAGEEETFDSAAFLGSDVAIEFTQPGSAQGNVLACLGRGVPVVSGTTGWDAEAPEVSEALEGAKGGTLLWSSNFSVGVNVFRRVSRCLAELMNAFGQYRPSVEEIHHIHKKDHPSGTAITLAEDIIEVHPAQERWSEEAGGAETLTISHRREGEEPGTHIIRWQSGEDEITLEHRALSREGFALGAVMAAEWLIGSGRRGRVRLEEMFEELINGKKSSEQINGKGNDKG